MNMSSQISQHHKNLCAKQFYLTMERGDVPTITPAEVGSRFIGAMTELGCACCNALVRQNTYVKIILLFKADGFSANVSEQHSAYLINNSFLLNKSTNQRTQYLQFQACYMKLRNSRPVPSSAHSLCVEHVCKYYECFK